MNQVGGVHARQDHVFSRRSQARRQNDLECVEHKPNLEEAKGVFCIDLATLVRKRLSTTLLRRSEAAMGMKQSKEVNSLMKSSVLRARRNT